MKTVRELIEARKVICAPIVDALNAFEAAMEGEGDPLLSAIAVAAMGNETGQSSQEEIDQIYKWCHEIVERSAIVALFLMGVVTLVPSGEGMEIKFSKGVRDKIEDGWCPLQLFEQGKS